MSTQKAKVFILTLLAMILATPLWPFEVRVPHSVRLGDAFRVEISYRNGGTGYLQWLGRRISFSLLRRRGSQYHLWLFLGSDVKRDRPGMYSLSIWTSRDRGIKRQIYLYPRRYSYTRIKVSARYSHLSRAALSRYFKEHEEIRRIHELFEPHAYFSGPFILPLRAPISSPYGRVRIINGKQRSIHLGVDFATGYGKKVHSINRGRVVLCKELLFSGKSVFIDHGLGIISEYFHLSAIDVSLNQMVEKGEVIGLTGKSGRVTGPHLHLGICVLGEMVDPISFIHLSQEKSLSATP